MPNYQDDMTAQQHADAIQDLEATLNIEQRLLYHRLRHLNLSIIPTAFTGIASALLIGGGQTMHSRFRIPIPTTKTLTVNVRADPNEHEFKNWLMEIGDGKSLPPRVCCPDNIVDQVFGPGQLELDVQNRLNNDLLCPTNKDALEINEVILLRLQGDNHEYLSTTMNYELVADIDDYPIEEAFLSTPQ
ncbi:ATP-dependent DNA helicase PIF7-like, partial [Brachionus plicatilis]